MTPSHQALVEALKATELRMNDQYDESVWNAAKAYAEFLPRLEELRVAYDLWQNAPGIVTRWEYQDKFEDAAKAFAQSLGEKK